MVVPDGGVALVPGFEFGLVLWFPAVAAGPVLFVEFWLPDR